jgi:hypothetical protein
MALVMAAGWLFRLRAYWFNRSLWMDEAALALNLTQASLVELLTKPLQNDQSAPLGFLAATKLLIELVSESEKVLRLLPLGAGLVTVILAAWLGALVFERRLARWVFVGLMAFSPILVYYSTEFKQYMLDVCFGMAVLTLGLYSHRLQEEGDRRKALTWIAVLGLVGAVSIWFSQPVVFFLFGAGVILVWQAIQWRQRTNAFVLFGIGMLWLASFGLSLVITMKNIADKPGLFTFWSAGFAPGWSGGFSSVVWLVETGLAAVYLAFQEYMVSGPYIQAGWYGGLNLVSGGMCAFGMAWLLKKPSALRAMLGLFALAVWAASYLEIYPLRGRLFLFITPVVFLGVAGMIEFLAEKNRKFSGVNYVLAAGVLAIGLVVSVRLLIKPVAFSEIRSVLPQLIARFEPGQDRLALSQWSQYAYTYYEPRFGLNQLGAPVIIPYDFDVAGFMHSVCALPERGRLWLVFSHRMSMARDFLAAVQTITPQLAQYESKGAGIYLYDFSAADLCTPP